MNAIHKISGNQLTLLRSGTEYFPQLCADIDAAQHSIYLETYIFAADQSGRMVADALQRAAARGGAGAGRRGGGGGRARCWWWVAALRGGRRLGGRMAPRGRRGSPGPGAPLQSRN